MLRVAQLQRLVKKPNMDVVVTVLVQPRERSTRVAKWTVSQVSLVVATTGRGQQQGIISRVVKFSVKTQNSVVVKIPRNQRKEKNRKDVEVSLMFGVQSVFYGVILKFSNVIC